MKLLSVFIATLVVVAAVHATPQRRNRDVGYGSNGAAAKTNGNGNGNGAGYGSNGSSAPKTNGNGAPKTNGASNGYSNGAPKTNGANGSNGYPKENPSNPLKLDAAAANKVEVRADSTTAAPMMGGEIPGNAGVDYPIFDTVPETSFSCKDQKSGGYFADVDEGRCQVFHVCHDERKFSFLCPNGTIFDQKVFVCNWWFNVDCAASKDFYELNAAIGVAPEKTEPLAVAPSIVDTVSSPASSYLPPNGDAAKTNGASNGYSNGASKNGATKTNGNGNGSAKPSYGAPAAAAAPASSYSNGNGNGNGKPSTAASSAVPVPAQSYLAPPGLAPNAAEAIVNGIITSTAAAPAQSYLPPNSGY